MKNIRVFLSENFQFLEVKVYLNRRVFVMYVPVHERPSAVNLKPSLHKQVAFTPSFTHISEQFFAAQWSVEYKN